MERAGHIGRRDDDAVRLRTRPGIGTGAEATRRFPSLVDLGFRLGEIKGFCKHHAESRFSQDQKSCEPTEEGVRSAEIRRRIAAVGPSPFRGLGPSDAESRLRARQATYESPHGPANQAPQPTIRRPPSPESRLQPTGPCRHRPPSDRHQKQPRSDRHPQRPPPDRHPERPRSDRHPQRPRSDRHPQRPRSDRHPERPPSDGHPERPPSDRRPDRPPSDRRPDRPPSDRRPDRPPSDIRAPIRRRPIRAPIRRRPRPRARPSLAPRQPASGRSDRPTGTECPQAGQRVGQRTPPQIRWVDRDRRNPAARPPEGHTDHWPVRPPEPTDRGREDPPPESPPSTRSLAGWIDDRCRGPESRIRRHHALGELERFRRIRVSVSARTACPICSIRLWISACPQASSCGMVITSIPVHSMFRLPGAVETRR